METLGDRLAVMEVETLGKTLPEGMSKRLVETQAARLAEVDVETYGNKMWRPRRSPR